MAETVTQYTAAQLAVYFLTEGLLGSRGLEGPEAMSHC